MESDTNHPKESSNKRGAQSIHRAVSLLRFVAKFNNQGGARLSDIAKEVGLHVATARRILLVLVQEGLITHDPQSKHYYLGLELFTLGSAAQQFMIRDKYRSALERIALETEDTVFLLMRSGNDALCVDRVEGSYPIRTQPIDVGARRPLGIGPGSLSLIAFLPEDQCEHFISANELRYPRYRNLTAEDIRNLAGQSRKSGYVVSESLFHEGAVSVGVPIQNGREDILAAITVAAIPQRMDSRRRLETAEIVKRVLQEYG